MNAPTALVPLVTLAAELNTTADALAAKFGDAVTLDDIGLRCVTRHDAREFVAAHHAALQAEAERRATEYAEARRKPHPVRERVRRLAASQKGAGGTDLPVVPYEAMR